MDQEGERRNKIPKNIPDQKNISEQLPSLTRLRDCVFLWPRCVVCCLPVTSNSQYVQFCANPDFPSNVNNLFSSAAEGHGSSIFQQRRELHCSWAVVCGRIHPRRIRDKSGKAPSDLLLELKKNCFYCWDLMSF